MIVAISDKVRSQLVALSAAQLSRNEAEEVERTHKVLTELMANLARVLSVYEALRSRLNETSSSYISSQLKQLANGITSSRHAYISDKRQATTLRRLNE